MIWPATHPATDVVAEPIPIDLDAIDAWSAVLDDLETQLGEPGDAIRTWTPPGTLGRLPSALTPRARALAAAQAAAVEQLTALREEVATDMARLQPVRKNAPALYLDVVA